MNKNHHQQFVYRKKSTPTNEYEYKKKKVYIAYINL